MNTYCKLWEPGLRRNCCSRVRVDQTCFFHAVNQGKTDLQVILPRGRHHTRTYSLPDDREAEEVGHVLQRRSHLPTREVERVCLRPPSVNERR